MTTAKLSLPELSVSQASKEITHNQALALLDQLTQMTVQDKDLATPPGSPANGHSYIVAGSPTGAWAGMAGKVAFWLTSVNAWTFISPHEGMLVHVNDEDVYYTYSGSAWSVFTGIGFANPMTTAGDLIRGGTGGAPTRLPIGTEGQILKCNGGSLVWSSESAVASQNISIACSDETTALTTGSAKATFRMPYAFTLSGVRASLTTAQSSGSILTVDINQSGSSILSTKITIDNSEKTSTTAAVAPVISNTSLANDAEITIDIDAIGNGTATGLKVYLIGVPA